MVLDNPFEPYLNLLQPTQNKVQARMEAEGAKRRFPIIGPLVGRLCETLATAVGARRVFEMGSGFGYSTLHFARAVGPKGTVVHTDGDAALSAEAQNWLAQAGLADRVDFRVGDARELLAAERKPFDVIFIDIDKEQYPDAFRIARPLLKVGGLLVADNALWSGRVYDAKARDEATEGVREYNRLAFSDPGLLSTLVPLRDGFAVSLRLR
jgi:predicted O-methyltransferase YrrM